MPRRFLSTRFAIAALSGGALALALLLTMSAGIGDDLGTGFVFYSFIIAIAAGSMTGILVWLFFGVPWTRQLGATGNACGSCGATVGRDWRLCPECGRMIEECAPPSAVAPDDLRAARTE